MTGSVPSGVSVVTNHRDPLDDTKHMVGGQDRCQVLESGNTIFFLTCLCPQKFLSCD